MRSESRDVFACELSVPRHFFVASTALVAFAGVATSFSAWAQQASGAATLELEEVVVTAERRDSTLQKVAASVSVRTGDELLRQGKYGLGDIVENVPGVSGLEYTGAGGSGSDTPMNNLKIRGLGSNDTATGQTITNAPATAVYVDEIYSGIGGNYDIERVEVLRGPQGTLYGRSATAGVLAIHTRNPVLDQFGFNGSLEIGNYDLRRINGSFNAPLVNDQLAVRLAVNKSGHDGYDVADGLGYIDTTEGRIKMLYQPAENFSVLVGAAFQDSKTRSGGQTIFLTSPDEYSVQNNSYIGQGENNFRQYWAEAKLDVGFANLTYVPGLRTWEQDAINAAVGPGGAYLRQNLRAPDDDFVTHELRLSSQADSPIGWQSGVFYYRNELTAVNNIDWWDTSAPLSYTSTQRTTKDVGVFAEATFPFTASLRFTAGVRYDDTQVQTDSSSTTYAPFGNGLPVTVGGDDGHSGFYNLTYKGRLEYDLTPDNLLYGMVSSAFVPGDVQISSGVVYHYSAEELTAYEVGSKNRFLDGALQVNASGFYYDYGGYQASLLQDPNVPTSARFFTIPVTMFGGELELTYAITAADRVGLNASIIKSRIHSAPEDFSDYSVLDELWGFPEETLSASYGHDFRFANGSSLLFNVEANWRGSYHIGTYSPTTAATVSDAYFVQKAIVLGNSNLTWTSPEKIYSVSAYIKNILDERYKTGVLPSGSSVTAELSTPQTYGLMFNVNF